MQVSTFLKEVTVPGKRQGRILEIEVPINLKRL